MHSFTNVSGAVLDDITRAGIILQYNETNKYVLFDRYVKSTIVEIHDMLSHMKYSDAIDKISVLKNKTPDDIEFHKDE